MLTDIELTGYFPFGGGKELALAGIGHFGEKAFRTEVLPIYRAICRIQETEYGESPSVAYLAEALQYGSRTNLENLAAYGLPLEEMHLLEYGRSSHDSAVRAEAVRRVLDGQVPGYRALVALHNVFQGGEPLIPYDRDIMDCIARRTRASE